MWIRRSSVWIRSESCGIFQPSSAPTQSWEWYGLNGKAGGSPEMLTPSLILFRLDYCNSVLMGLPKQSSNHSKVSTTQLQLQDSCITISLKSTNVAYLCWEQRIKYKCSYVNKIITSSVPRYLSELAHLYLSSTTFHSSATQKSSSQFQMEIVQTSFFSFCNQDLELFLFL